MTYIHLNCNLFDSYQICSMDFGDCCEAVIDSKISMISGNPIPKMRRTTYIIDSIYCTVYAISTVVPMSRIVQIVKEVRIGSVAFLNTKIN